MCAETVTSRGTEPNGAAGTQVLEHRTVTPTQRCIGLTQFTVPVLKPPGVPVPARWRGAEADAKAGIAPEPPCPCLVVSCVWLGPSLTRTDCSAMLMLATQA